MPKSKLPHALVLVVAAVVTHAGPELEVEQLNTLELPAASHQHWVWVNDLAGFGIDAKAYLFNADNGRMLGMLSTSIIHDALVLPRNHKAIYASDTFYSRQTRGVRTDVVTIYDPIRLAPVGEVVIPPKQMIGGPNIWQSQLTDDDRFLLIYNFTPAQSVTVVDTAVPVLVGEIETPGCMFLFPSGPRRFHMIRNDGAILTVRLDEKGEPVKKTLTGPLFDADTKFLHESAVRSGQQYYFVSYEGDIHTLDVSGEEPTMKAAWPLQSPSERDEWWPGGTQLIALHTGSGRFYVAMHRGGINSQKDPGEEIWVYDINSQQRLARYEVKTPVTTMAVSQDDEPLLYTAFFEKPQLEIYDALSGKHLRTVDQVGTNPSVLQIP